MVACISAQAWWYLNAVVRGAEGCCFLLANFVDLVGYISRFSHVDTASYTWNKYHWVCNSF